MAFSDARVHDGENIRVTGLLLDGETDELLKPLVADDPIKRDHVSIDACGSAHAAERGKYDRTDLRAGGCAYRVS